MCVVARLVLFYVIKLHCFNQHAIQQKDAASKSRGNLIEDEALEWLKPRALIKPDDQEDVPEAVRKKIQLKA